MGLISILLHLVESSYFASLMIAMNGDVDTQLDERLKPLMSGVATNHSEARRRELTDEVDQHVPLASVVGGVGQ